MVKARLSERPPARDCGGPMRDVLHAVRSLLLVDPFGPAQADEENADALVFDVAAAGTSRGQEAAAATAARLQRHRRRGDSPLLLVRAPGSGAAADQLLDAVMSERPDAILLAGCPGSRLAPAVRRQARGAGSEPRDAGRGDRPPGRDRVEPGRDAGRARVGGEPPTGFPGCAGTPARLRRRVAHRPPPSRPGSLPRGYGRC